MTAISVYNILFGVLYDTGDFGDTIFLLGAGWRANQGLMPVLDFGHFYGGVMAVGIGGTMRLFGPDVFAFERFALILLASLVLLAIAVLRHRLSFNGLMALILILATLMLTRYPMETNEPIIRIVSTHSFLYNRFGLALFLIAGLFVALRATINRGDLLPGVLVGILMVLSALTKPTFIVLAPGVLLGLMLQRRWPAVTAVLIGMAAAVSILDPMLQKWLGSLAYVQAQVGDQASAEIGALLRKAVQLPLSQPVATTFALTMLSVLFLTRTQLASAFGLLVVAGSGIGMATTMGGNGSLGHLSLPVAVLIALAAGEIARRNRLKQASSMQMIAYALVASLAVPHMLNLAGATLEGLARQDQMLISEGPYVRYLSVPEKDGDDYETPTQYEMFADGLTALHDLGEPSQWGIIADRGITFEHAVLGRPVPGYPLWQRPTSPELALDRPIAPGADIVMIGRSVTLDSVGVILITKLGQEFVPCTMSAHWEIFVRRASGISCSGS